MLLSRLAVWSNFGGIGHAIADDKARGTDLWVLCFRVWLRRGDRGCRATVRIFSFEDVRPATQLFFRRLERSVKSQEVQLEISASTPWV